MNCRRHGLGLDLGEGVTFGVRGAHTRTVQGRLEAERHRSDGGTWRGRGKGGGWEWGLCLTDFFQTLHIHGRKIN